eukprot:m.287179 g.287179  ORF g.287179 m.287179 type:complete len:318 (+) comp11726_c0_seq1:130-1083(+)
MFLLNKRIGYVTEGSASVLRSPVFGYTAFLVYRILLASYFVATIIADAVQGTMSPDEVDWKPDHWQGGPDPYWFLYLTNWTYLLDTIYVVFALFVLVSGDSDVKYRNDISRRMKFRERAQWGLFEVAYVASLTVTILYWTILFPFGDLYVYFFGVNMHGIHWVLLTVELFVTYLPIYVEHMWATMLYAATYIVFSMVYLFAGGKVREFPRECDDEADPDAFCQSINAGNCGTLYAGYCDIPTQQDRMYPPQDWTDRPGVAAASALVGIFIVIPILQILSHGLYRLRAKLYHEEIDRDTINDHNLSDPAPRLRHTATV